MIQHNNLIEQQRNEVAEAKRRRSNAKFENDMGSRRSTTPTVWPCQINGCTKTFVREADLKRHQKTTKTHSNPSFQCQDCNARFTRTDALRRHRRSRHHVNQELHAPRTSSEVSGLMSMPGFRSTRCSSMSEGSTRSRSLSPRPSQVQGQEGRERERRSREPVPTSDLTGLISRYPRYAQYTDMRIHCSVSPYPPSPPVPPASPPQTFLRGQPTHSSSLNAILASPIPTPRLQPVRWSTEHNKSLCGRTSPPPRLPSSSLRGDSHLVPRSAKALSISADPTLPPRQPLGHGPGPDQGKNARSARIKCGTVDASKKGHQLPVTPLSPPPPIVSAHPNSRSTPSFNFDSSDSEDDEDEGAEFDELLPSSPEPELEESEGTSYRNCNHRIPGIDACINPSITEEEAKMAMDAVLKSQRKREQQKVFTDSLAKGTRGREDLGGIEIRMASTADRDGLPSLSKVSPSLSSSSLSSTTLVNDGHDVPSRCGLPDMHRKPGKRIHANSIRPSSFVKYHRDDHSQSEDDEDENGMDVLVDKSLSDMDADERSNFNMYTRPVGGEERAVGAVRVKGGRLGNVKVHGINELHEYDDDDEDGYGAYSPPPDRSYPQYLAYDLTERMVRPG